MATRPASRPESVTVGPFEWSVHWDAKAIKEFGHCAGDPVFGQTHPNDLTIWIDPDRPEQALRETVLHELLHAVVSTFDIRVPYSMGDDDGFSREERLVASLSSPLLDVLRRNPPLTGWLLEEAAGG